MCFGVGFWVKDGRCFCFKIAFSEIQRAMRALEVIKYFPILFIYRHIPVDDVSGTFRA